MAVTRVSLHRRIKAARPRRTDLTDNGVPALPLQPLAGPDAAPYLDTPRDTVLNGELGNHTDFVRAYTDPRLLGDRYLSLQQALRRKSGKLLTIRRERRVTLGVLSLSL